MVLKEKLVPKETRESRGIKEPLVLKAQKDQKETKGRKVRSA